MVQDGRETWVRAYPVAIDANRLRQAAASIAVAAYEEEVLARRRDYLIIRVDRADLSKNVLRGHGFDAFLQQHPQFRERVTFVAHLQFSRQDVSEYVEYLEDRGRRWPSSTATPPTGCRSTCGSTKSSRRR